MKDNITVVRDSRSAFRKKDVLLWYGPFHGETRKLRFPGEVEVIYGNETRAEYINCCVRTHYPIEKYWVEYFDYPVLVHRETAETILAFGPNPPWDTDNMEPPF